MKSQVEKQLAAGDNVVFDVDVKGGCRIKEMYGDRALSMFMTFAPKFDTVVINDDLEKAEAEAFAKLKAFLDK